MPGLDSGAQAIEAIERNVTVPLADGGVLSADTFRPKGKGSYPVIPAKALYVCNEERELLFLLQSTEQRYRDMRQRLGAQVDQIAQHHLASY